MVDTLEAKKSYDDYWYKPLWEKVLYAFLYELIAILLIAPVSAYIYDKPVLQMGALTFIMATVAMLWNMVYNGTLDFLFHRFEIKKTNKARVAQAFGFEGGLIFILVPVASWYLNISYLDAFILDIGFFLFYLPYTYIFGWAYDTIRQWYVIKYIIR